MFREFRHIQHLNRDLFVAGVVGAFFRQDDRFVVTAFFEEVVELFGIVGQARLTFEFRFAFLRDESVDVFILLLQRDAGAVRGEERFGVGDRDVEAVREERFVRGVEVRRFDFGAKLLQVGERFFRSGFANLVLLRDERGDFVLQRFRRLRQVDTRGGRDDFRSRGGRSRETSDFGVDFANRRGVEFRRVAERVAIVGQRGFFIALRESGFRFLNVKVAGAFARRDARNRRLDLANRRLRTSRRDVAEELRRGVAARERVFRNPLRLERANRLFGAFRLTVRDQNARLTERFLSRRDLTLRRFRKTGQRRLRSGRSGEREAVVGDAALNRRDVHLAFDRRGVENDVKVASFRDELFGGVQVLATAKPFGLFEVALRQLAFDGFGHPLGASRRFGAFVLLDERKNVFRTVAGRAVLSVQRLRFLRVAFRRDDVATHQRTASFQKEFLTPNKRRIGRGVRINAEDGRSRRGLSESVRSKGRRSAERKRRRAEAQRDRQQTSLNLFGWFQHDTPFETRCYTLSVTSGTISHP